MSSFVSQIVYPDYLLTQTKKSYLVGWNLEGFHCCIVSWIPVQDVTNYQDLCAVLSDSNNTLSHIYRYCSRDGQALPTVVGVWIPSNTQLEASLGEQDESSPNNDCSFQKQSSLWITLSPSTISTQTSSSHANRNSRVPSNFSNDTKSLNSGSKDCSASASIFRPAKDDVPQLISLYSLGSCYNAQVSMVQYAFKNGDRLDCYIDDNIFHKLARTKVKSAIDEELKNNLNCNQNKSTSDAASCYSGSFDMNNIKPTLRTGTLNNISLSNDNYCESEEQPLLSRLSSSMRDSKGNSKRVQGRTLSSSGDLTVVFGTQYLIAQLNCASTLHSLITYGVGNLGYNERELGVEISDRFCGKCVDTLNYRCLLRFKKVLSRAAIPLSALWLIIANRCKQLLEQRYTFSCVPVIAIAWLGIERGTASSMMLLRLGISPSEVSFAAMHLKWRYFMFNEIFTNCVKYLVSYKYTLICQRKAQRDVIFKYCCLIMVDVLLGLLFSHILLRSQVLVVDRLVETGLLTEKTFLLRTLTWLTQAPLGIKLSSLITVKLNSLLKFFIINVHKLYIILTKRYGMLTVLLRIIAYSGHIGFLLQLSLLIDLLRVLTFHVTIVHRLFALQHISQLNLIRTLYYLFQGKKINTLRKRIDTCIYDKKQLLFGTALFAINIFLLPSFAVYYYFFTFSQALILNALSILSILYMLILNFPYYQLASYLLGLGFLVKGLQFKLLLEYRSKYEVPCHVNGDESPRAAKVVNRGDMANSVRTIKNGFSTNPVRCDITKPPSHYGGNIMRERIKSRQQQSVSRSHLSSAYAPIPVRQPMKIIIADVAESVVESPGDNQKLKSLQTVASSSSVVTWKEDETVPVVSVSEVQPVPRMSILSKVLQSYNPPVHLQTYNSSIGGLSHAAAGQSSSSLSLNQFTQRPCVVSDLQTLSKSARVLTSNKYAVSTQPFSPNAHSVDKQSHRSQVSQSNIKMKSDFNDQSTCRLDISPPNHSGSPHSSSQPPSQPMPTHLVIADVMASPVSLMLAPYLQDWNFLLNSTEHGIAKDTPVLATVSGSTASHCNVASRYINGLLLGYPAVDISIIQSINELWVHRCSVSSSFDTLCGYIGVSSEVADAACAGKEQSSQSSLLWQVDDKQYWNALHTVLNQHLNSVYASETAGKMPTCEMAHILLSSKLFTFIIFLLAVSFLSTVVGAALFIRTFFT